MTEPGDRSHLVDAMGDGVVFDADGRYVDVNSSLLAITGYDRESVLGADLSLLHDEAGARAVDEALTALREASDGGSETVASTLVTNRGERVPVELRLSPLDDAGAFDGAVGVLRESATQARHQEHERYARLIEASGDAVYALDTDGRFTFSNEAHQRIVGRDEADLLGEHASIALPDEAVADGNELIRELLESGRRNGTFEMDVRRPDGEVIPTENHLALLTDEDGEFSGSVGVLRDISERLRRERELERYARLIEASGDAVYALDSAGRFTFSNEAHQEIVDRDAADLLGEHASIALPEEAVADGNRLIQELLESGRPNGTFVMDVLRPDGEVIPTENHVALLTDEDGEFRGTVGVLRDISVRQHRERELERQNERLERFASVVSHDLRNPLNVALGYLDIADVEGEAGEKVQQSLDRMEAIIQNVLELSRKGQTIDERVPVDLADLATVAWNTVETEGATLALDADATVLADESRLAAVLENLFRNAVEHGSTNGPAGSADAGGDGPAVRLGTTPAGFYVEDDGPGIPTDERETVFEMGYTTSDAGTGFGLAIVDEIAHAHDWEVSVAESPAGGARFEFTEVDRPAQTRA